MGGRLFISVLVGLLLLTACRAPADAVSESKPLAWRAAFDEVYQLADREVVEFIFFRLTPGLHEHLLRELQSRMDAQ